jgi:hypothetical protein
MGAKILKGVLKILKNMTPEEYSQLYLEAQKECGEFFEMTEPEEKCPALRKYPPKNPKKLTGMEKEYALAECCIQCDQSEQGRAALAWMKKQAKALDPSVSDDAKPLALARVIGFHIVVEKEKPLFKYGVIWKNSHYAVGGTIFNKAQEAYNWYIQYPYAEEHQNDWGIYKCISVLYGGKFFKWSSVKATPEKIRKKNCIEEDENE